jgi:tyrosyl-tRNA synthetase
MPMKSFLDELKWRGLLHQTTAGDELVKHIGQPNRVAYCGFDPTSDSLTIGNFIQIKLLMHWQQCGHKPIVVMGGGTGLIGDPSGKDAERQMLTRDAVRANVEGQRRIYEKLLDFDQRNPNAASIVDNADWLTKLGFVEVLRDVGKHFSVNTMIQKESVKERLHNREQGISYTEFSYMILQAFDFLHLRRTMNCTVQTAGSDQYGNIVAGIDLIRREFGHDQAFGITSPLVKAASGKKIGKTEKGAVWLTADRTSPYAFYQYWINVEDQDAIQFLSWFTMMNQDQVADIRRQHEAEPHLRHAHRELARNMTRLIHGDSELGKVEAASLALFSGDVRGLDQKMLAEVFADVPHSQHSKAQLESGVDLVELLPQTSLATSKREAREFLASGAVSVNGEKVNGETRLTTSHLLHGRTILLKRGKKNWHATKWE